MSLPFCPAPGYDCELSSCSFLGNITNVQHSFEMMFSRFDALYKRKRSVQFYEECGVEEDMFLDAWPSCRVIGTIMGGLRGMSGI